MHQGIDKEELARQCDQDGRTDILVKGKNAKRTKEKRQ